MDNYGKINKHVGWNKRVGRKILSNLITMLVENFKNCSSKDKKNLKDEKNVT